MVTMRYRHIKLKQWHALRTLLLFLLPILLYLSYTAPQLLPIQMGITGPGSQFDGIRIAPDNSISLLAQAAQPPAGESRYQRYGFYLSPVQYLQQPAAQVRVDYAAAVPSGSAVQLDVRVSNDGMTWTPWQIDLESGATASFPATASQVQYRVRLFGSSASGPVVYGVQLYAVDTPGQVLAMPAENAVAPTFRVHATREGLVGHRTANGHIIQPRDHFVSLPSWRSLSSLGGNEYQVRITYQGRSAVAPVWDVGPWNTRDDYWNVEREVWKELPQGWPQDHAAYFDGHNGGYAQYGYVRFPTAIDVGDGTWWDDLGIQGGQAEVDVTFLWMGRDPLAVPEPSNDPNAAEYMVDELGSAFYPNKATWHSWTENGCGLDDHAYWTLTVTGTGQIENKAFWNPVLPTAGLYDVYAYVPDCPNEYLDTTQARYLVQYNGGAKEVVVDQARQKGWVLLGRFPFAADDSGFVHLTDLAGDAAERAIWFDNVRWVPVRE